MYITWNSTRIEPRHLKQSSFVPASSSHTPFSSRHTTLSETKLLYSIEDTPRMGWIERSENTPNDNIVHDARRSRGHPHLLPRLPGLKAARYAYSFQDEFGKITAFPLMGSTSAMQLK
ncbi:unnamed protein product [Nezara viridula]|uniref:Uncharacterized protein n=1 Tax=Nezara viridula TaxID=85310 RepID=A0A9P0EB62_NEZVI|nr:unnamed protein product [Nezara viridula]